MNEEAQPILLDYLDVILNPLVALIGIIVAIPILRKKLTENHISASLQDIQQNNLKIQLKNQQLIDIYKSRTTQDKILSKEEIQVVYEEIQAAYQFSLSASSDVSTLLFYLKTTLYKTLEDFDRVNEDFFSRRFYHFIIDILEFVNFFSAQAVQIPKSSQTIKKKLVKEELVKYVTHSHIYKYKYFQRGLIEDPHSLHYLRFCEEVNRYGFQLLMRSSFKIFWHPAPMAKLLYFHKIYSPLKITGFGNILFSDEKLALYLIGFRLVTEYNKNGKKNFVKLFYSNPEENLSFVSALVENENPLRNAKDDYLKSSNFSFKKARVSGSGYELLEVTVNKEYLAEEHRRHKKEIREKLKKKQLWTSKILFWKI